MGLSAFEQIAKELRPCLVGIGLNFFGDADKAEDVAQEVLLRLWLLRERIDFTVPVRPLAVRMAKNVCISMWRHDSHTSPEATGKDIADTVTVSPPEMEDSDNTRLLHCAMEGLTAAERRLMRLRNEEGLDIQQISAITGIAPRSVSVMLSRARHKILNMLKKGGHL